MWHGGECHYLFAVVIVVGMRADYYACICSIILVLVYATCVIFSRLYFLKSGSVCARGIC